MGIVTKQITPDVIRSVAAQLSEDRGSTASALTAAVPSALTALSDVASSDEGARHLKDVIDEKRHVATDLDDDRPLFPSPAADAADHAATLIEDELGPRSRTIAAAVADATGVRTDSAEKLIGGVATVAVAALARSSTGLGAGTLRAIFHEQRGEWVSRLPAAVASLFNGHSGHPEHSEHSRQARAFASDPGGRHYDDRLVTGPAIRELEAPRRNWMIPMILLALALLAIPVMRGMRRARTPALPQQPPQAATVPADVPRATPPAPTPPTSEETPPPPEAPAVEPGTTSDLAAFLGESGEMTPHAFAPSPLNFPFGSARPTPESMKTIDEIAAALKAHPAAKVRIESHTDNLGTARSNLDLSQARADAIKNELVDRGVDGARVETAGMGGEFPIASNDTTEGRARNRRSEIVVTAR